LFNLFKTNQKSKGRLNYIRPFHNKELDEKEVITEKKQERIIDGIDVNNCFQCTDLKSSGGTLRCYRDKCKYN